MPKNSSPCTFGLDGLEVAKAIGKRIAHRRATVFGLSQKDLAKAIGVKPLKMSHIETGTSNGQPYQIKGFDLIKICKVLNSTPNYILLKIEPQNNETSKRKSELLTQENSQLKKEIIALKDHIKTLKKVKGI